MTPDFAADVHQHLWPEPFLAALRQRRRPPRLDGWTLRLEGERPWPVEPRDHDVAARAAADPRALVLVSPSAGLGIDRLAPEEAEELASAWLDGALALPAPFRAWATAGVLRPEPGALEDALDRGAVGLEVAADALAAPGGIERLAPLLDVLQRRGRPMLVHPGPAGAEDATGRPRWWAPVVTYAAQLQAAWWAWAHAGRAAFEELLVCFAALAGLARDVARRPELWQHRLDADATERTYAALHRDAHVDVWAISWRPENDTGWHDHDTSSGAVQVVRGALEESVLRLGRGGGRRSYASRETFSFAPTHI